MIWLLTLLAYLLGSFSFAIVLCRLASRPDPRQNGSGNPGATNVLRVAGKQLALWTLIGDLCKGLLPVLLAAEMGLSTSQQAWVGFGAFLGHLYPVFFSFNGGKGVATAAGILLGLHPASALMALSAWGITFALTRTSSLAAMTALPVCLPLLAWQQPESLLPISLLAGFMIWRHRRNLQDLLAGSERHFKSH